MSRFLPSSYSEPAQNPGWPLSLFSDSISRRFTLAGLLLTGLIGALLSVPSFTLTYLLIHGNARETLENRAELLARRLEWNLNEFHQRGAVLADKTLVANALVDSRGRDGYLIPF